ncbi:integrase [Ammoniphilus oxalaticus]|uniref:Integrase n=1 Tax=Ammoniphilus oxalaticus TaxID=66863 RepID=A0A419SQR0_9BACL|nr:integrase [Ammoniphilus oxalaticus]
MRYKDPFTQKYKEKTKGGFRTKREAQIEAMEEERKLLEGIEQAPISLKDYLKEWLIQYKKDVVRKNTFEIHERNIRNHIVPYFKKIQLSDIKPIMYQKFLNHIIDQGYSKRTGEIIHSTMHNALERAVTIGALEKNPTAGAIVKGVKKEKDLKYMESNHIAHFLQTAYQYNYIYWIFFKVLIETGMRKGEAAALQWPDIDLKEGKIHINKTLDFKAKANEDRFGDTKTYSSRRTITISAGLVQDLQFHIKHQNQNKLALNDIYHHDLNLVLCRNDGDIMPTSTLFNAFARILKQAGLPNLPIHSLRHTHAVLLLEAGAEMKYIQERLGHGSIQVTSDVYAHVSKKIDEDTMDKFEQHMKDVLQ